MERKARISYLLGRYLDNSCTREEMDELLDLMQAGRHDEEIRRCMDQVWEQAGGRLPRAAKKTAWSFSWQKTAAIAAMFVLIAGVVYTYRYFTGETPVQQHYLEVVSGIGERKQVRLPDSSTVWLNTSSKVRYPREFSGDNRELFLEGEAFFSVTPDTGKPFLVRSRHLVTQVLGTEFNVEAYKDDEKVNITVLKGKVQVGDSANSLGAITSGQQIHYNLATREAKTVQVNAKALTAWKDGELVFDNVTLAEAAGTIEKWYGVNIQLNHAGLKNCRFTASFREEDDLEQVLSVICGLNEIRYSVDNNKIMLKGKGCE